MAVTLNCGIGMVVICAPDDATKIMDNLTANGEEVFKIGYLETRKDNAPSVIIKNTETAWVS